jgi:hypothetical protein
MPPIRALKKTAGKKKNHTKGWTVGESTHCSARAASGSNIEIVRTIGVLRVFSLAVSAIRLHTALAMRFDLIARSKPAMPPINFRMSASNRPLSRRLLGLPAAAHVATNLSFMRTPSDP